MKAAIWLINDRFLVNTTRNELVDQATDTHAGLEPRLMKLLELLIEQAGSVVSRETAIERIWANYPGANEGLNQAISTLRKLLDDAPKRLIQTIPKTGYVFQGIVSTELPVIGGESAQPVRSRIALSISYRTAAILGSLLISLLVGVLYGGRSATPIGEASLEQADGSSQFDSLRLQQLGTLRERIRMERKIRSLDSLSPLQPLQLSAVSR